MTCINNIQIIYLAPFLFFSGFSRMLLLDHDYPKQRNLKKREKKKKIGELGFKYRK